MKKLITICLAFAMLLSCVSCGDKPSEGTSYTTKNPPVDSQETTTSPRNPIDQTKVTLEQLRAAKQLSAEDFNFVGNGVAGYTMHSYLGSETILHLPDEYNGGAIIGNSSYIFANDSPVKAIWFPDSLIEVNDATCGLNKSLQVVILGEKTKTIGQSAFKNCSSLYVIELNEGLEVIETFAFGHCDSLKSITIPKSVTNIYSGAFFGCPEDFVIYGEAGSAAEAYANSEGIEFRVK